MAAAKAAVSSVMPSPTAPKLSGPTASASRAARLRATVVPAAVAVAAERLAAPVRVPTGSADSTLPDRKSPAPTAIGCGAPRPLLRPSRPAGRVISACMPASNCARLMRRSTPPWLAGKASVSAAARAGASSSIVGIVQPPIRMGLPFWSVITAPPAACNAPEGVCWAASASTGSATARPSTRPEVVVTVN